MLSGIGVYYFLRSGYPSWLRTIGAKRLFAAFR
jgi:hypothetical protein